MHRLVISILLIVGIIFSVYLVLQNTSLFSKAAPDISPKSVTISNISDSSFTVSWVTDNETIGFVKYSEDLSLNKSAYDDRGEGSKARVTHFVVLKDLSPKQNYLFKISSAGQVFGLGQNNFEQQTAPVTEETPSLPILTFGKIKKKNNEIPKEAIVYLKLPNSTTLSTSTGDDGNYLITVTNARKIDLSSYIEVKDEDAGEVWVEGGTDGKLQSQQIKINNSQALADLTLEEPVIVTRSCKKGEGCAFSNAYWIKWLLKL